MCKDCKLENASFFMLLSIGFHQLKFYNDHIQSFDYLNAFEGFDSQTFDKQTPSIQGNE